MSKQQLWMLIAAVVIVASVEQFFPAKRGVASTSTGTAVTNDGMDEGA